MSTKVSAFMGGLGIDARNKLELGITQPFK